MVILYIYIPILNSTNTGVSRRHLLIVIYLRPGLGPGYPTLPPPREGTVGRGPGLSPIVNYLPDNWARLRAFGYLADNLMGVRPGPRPCKDPKIPQVGGGGFLLPSSLLS